MASSTVYDAIKAKLVTDLGGTYAVRDFEEIDVIVPQQTDPWIAVEDGSGSDTLDSIGSPDQNWVSDTGFIDVHVFTRSDTSLSTGRDIGELVRQSLRYYRPSVPAGEVLRIVGVTPPSTGLIYDGLWSSVLVSVNYTHQYAVATAAE